MKFLFPSTIASFGSFIAPGAKVPNEMQQMPTTNPGFWTRADVARRYASLTGCDLDYLPPMRVLALFKLGIVFLQLHRQWVNGAVKDDRYAGFARLGENMLQIARGVSTGEVT